MEFKGFSLSLLGLFFSDFWFCLSSEKKKKSLDLFMALYLIKSVFKKQ